MTRSHRIWRRGLGGCSAAALALLAVAFWRGSSAWRKFAALAALILASSLIEPVGTPDTKQWVLMDIPGVGCRYFFFPIMAWFTGVLVLASQTGKLKFAGFLLPLFLIGVCADWHYNLPKNDAARLYHKAAKIYRHAKPGTGVNFPEDPPGWTMRLIKR